MCTSSFCGVPGQSTVEHFIRSAVEVQGSSFRFFIRDESALSTQIVRHSVPKPLFQDTVTSTLVECVVTQNLKKPTCRCFPANGHSEVPVPCQLALELSTHTWLHFLLALGSNVAFLCGIKAAACLSIIPHHRNWFLIWASILIVVLTALSEAACICAGLSRCR